jgi:hypothetical protein
MSSIEQVRFDNLRVLLLVVALAGALFVHFLLDMPLGFSLMIFFVGWPIGGTLVTIDDDFKGGWSNRDGKVQPSWLKAPFWGQVVGGFAISFAGFAIDAGWRSFGGARFWLLAIGTTSLAAALLSRRWWLLLGMAVGFGALWTKAG